MPDVKKVIKGLECCDDAVSKCGENCPYWIIENCQSNMQADALALLKAQEPRVMTFDEVKKHYNLPPVFPDDLGMQEDYYQDIQPLYFEFPNQCEWNVHWRGSNQVCTYLDEWKDKYNKTWRVWTSRPTDEQRKKEPWDGQA